MRQRRHVTNLMPVSIRHQVDAPARVGPAVPIATAHSITKRMSLQHPVAPSSARACHTGRNVSMTVGAVTAPTAIPPMPGKANAGQPVSGREGG